MDTEIAVCCIKQLFQIAEGHCIINSECAHDTQTYPLMNEVIERISIRLLSEIPDNAQDTGSVVYRLVVRFNFFL
jgi:hypothetical protein